MEVIGKKERERWPAGRKDCDLRRKQERQLTGRRKRAVKKHAARLGGGKEGG